MGEDVAIRPASQADMGALALVGSATFLETYAGRIPGADIVAHCASRHSAATYLAWLADPANTIWLAEVRGGAPVGYLVLTRATLPDPHPHPEDLEVQRIYVLRRFHGAGVGHRLISAGDRDGARGRGTPACARGAENQ